MGGRTFSVGVLIALVVLAVMPGNLAELTQPWRLDEPGPIMNPDAFVPFSPNVRVNSGNPTYLQQVEPTMAINSQGRLFVGWKEAFTHNGGGQRVAFSVSTDGGATWAPNVLMPLHTYARQSDPWLMVTDGDRVYFSRIEYDGPSFPGGIAITNTTDGVTWGATQLLRDAPNFADKQTHAHDAAGNLYVAWNSDDVSAGLYDVVFSRSDDGGASWTPKVRVPDASSGALGAFVRVGPAGEVYVTWWSRFSENLYFDRSLNGGVTWGVDVRVNDALGSAESPLANDPPILPAMAVAPNGTVYVVWNDYRNGRPGGTPNGDFDIMLARSEDGGTTWSASRRLNDDARTARQWMPDLALDPFGGVHAAWMDDRNGAHDVYYVNSTDGGTTWGPNVRVTNVSTPLSYDRPGDYLALESDRNGHVYVVWTDGRGTDLDIYSAKLERTTAVIVDTIPANLTIEVDGVPHAAPYPFSCVTGTTRMVNAPSPQGSGGTRHQFLSWSDGGPPTHWLGCTTPSTYTASFLTEHEVTLATSPPGLELMEDGIPLPDPAILWWSQGTVHSIGAPSPQTSGPVRYLFESWSDGGPQYRAITTTGPATLVASFRVQFLLTVTSPYGTANCGAADCWHDAGGTATFSVSPSVVDGPPGTRYAFRAWSEDASGSTPTGTVPMDAPKNVTATWATEHRLTIVSAHGSPIGAGWHEEGTNVSVDIEETVVADGTTYRFVGWTGDATAADPAVHVLMDGPKALTAVWEEVPGTPPSQSLGVPAWLILLVVVFLILVLFFWRRRKREETPGAGPPPT